MNEIPQYATTLSDGHPVKVYFEENVLIRALLQQLVTTDINQDYEKFFNIFNQLSEIEKRFARKENQLMWTPSCQQQKI